MFRNPVHQVACIIVHFLLFLAEIVIVELEVGRETLFGAVPINNSS